MENVYLISDFSEKMKKIAGNIGISKSNIISYQAKEKESDFHNWLNEELKTKNVDKIIIPVSIGNEGMINTDGLLLGLHIRLNYELPIEKRSIPIIFLSNLSVENIIKKNQFDTDSNSQNLIFTEGIYFSLFAKEQIISIIAKANPCGDYNSFLSKLNVRRKAYTGGHDIANAWGCYKIAQVIGDDNEIFKLPSISKYLNQLYAKFLICRNEAFSKEKRIDLEPIKCRNKKILFIDDKADEGWGKLMRDIFKGAEAEENFSSIDSSQYKANDIHRSFKDFDGFYHECKAQIGKPWDLIIIDLRLNPEKEDIDNEMIRPSDFAGYKLIDEFLKNNGGYQLIVLTASNKIWNVNTALKRGASSYFIKESPEFNYSLSETKKHFDNFKNDVNECFKRGYLRTFYTEIYQLKSQLGESDFTDEIKNQLDLFWRMILKAQTKEDFPYSYVSLYLIIEIINKNFLNEIKEECYWNQDKKLYEFKKIDRLTEWNKIAYLYFKKWNGTDNIFVRDLHYLIIKRNGFIHNDRNILDKQNKEGIYINHDIYEEEGVIKLFNAVKQLLGYL